MQINLRNVEEIIFFDNKVQEILPEFRHFFDQWRLGRTISALGSMATKSIFDFLNSLQEEHINRLENYFQTSIVVNKLERGVVKHHTIEKDGNLCGFTEFKEFSISRNKDKVSLTFWR